MPLSLSRYKNFLPVSQSSFSAFAPSLSFRPKQANVLELLKYLLSLSLSLSVAQSSPSFISFFLLFLVPGVFTLSSSSSRSRSSLFRTFFSFKAPVKVSRVRSISVAPSSWLIAGRGSFPAGLSAKFFVENANARK